MNDSIRRFLESMVEDGTPMEDVLNEVANTATEMKAQEDEESRKEKEIDELLQIGIDSILKAINLIDPELNTMTKKSLTTETLRELVEYMRAIKCFIPESLMDEFLA